MPRAARVVVPQVALHIVQRGVNRGPVFFRDADRARYAISLMRLAAEVGCAIHAYCLMDNHVHLLLTPHEPEACARLMKQLNQCHVQSINRRLGRSGPLWGGRFRSSLIHSAHYALACYRYIEQNPVRAGMVGHAGEYRWSSYAGNASGGPAAGLQPHAVYEALGDTVAQRSAAYRDLITLPMAPETVEAIREATRRNVPIGAPRPRRGRPRKPAAEAPPGNGSEPAVLKGK